MCKVSVIIPIYKVERFLTECLESVQKQTFSDFEVMMVDDGSPDGSAEICRRYAAQDARFRLLQQPNSGVTAARRAGVAQARGEYVMFVDGDDTLPPDAMDVLLRHMNDEVDIVMGCAREFYEEKPIQRAVIEEYRRMLINVKLNLAMWAILFRRSLFTDYVFDMSRDIVTGEDWIANLRLAFNTEKPVMIIPDAVYHYRMHEGGITCAMKWTVEHDKLVYDALCASVPSELQAQYLPVLAAAYAPIWFRLTKRMIRLSPAAEYIRQHILTHISTLKSRLRMPEYLFLHCTNPVGRAGLILLSLINGALQGKLYCFYRRRKSV